MNTKDPQPIRILRQSGRQAVGRWLTIGAAAAAAGSLIALAASRFVPAGPGGPVAEAIPADLRNYAGDNACRRCHPAEFESYLATVHRTSLRPATRGALGGLCPTPGRINNSQYALIERDGRLFYEVNPPGAPDKYQLWPLDYAFGSGRKGVSFASMLEGRNVVEMKMSWFPREHTWHVTPGQQMGDPAAAGNLGNLVQSRRCLGCHSIALSKSEFVPRTAMMGVGCESCHGPGRAHAAARAGAPGPQMADLGKIGALALNTLCGRCHQTAKDVTSSPVLAKMTYRFQPYGLMISRCFLESDNKLSCLACHSAHEDAPPRSAVIERACLSCHSGPRQVPSGSIAGKTCPISPRTGCIRCHMPRRDVLSALGRTSGIRMTEHRIGIYRNPEQN